MREKKCVNQWVGRMRGKTFPQIIKRLFFFLFHSITSIDHMWFVVAETVQNQLKYKIGPKLDFLSFNKHATQNAMSKKVHHILSCNCYSIWSSQHRHVSSLKGSTESEMLNVCTFWVAKRKYCNYGSTEGTEPHWVKTLPQLQMSLVQRFHQQPKCPLARHRTTTDKTVLKQSGYVTQ